MLKAYRKIKLHLINILFPIKCIHCGHEGDWICHKCFSSIRINEEHHCPICEKAITPDGRTCFSCKKKSPLDGLVISTSYKNKIISQAIHLFKYRFISDLHRPLGELLVKSLQGTEVPICDLIIPIPLHSKRLRWRGFNQSDLLATHISKNLLPIEINLERNNLCRIKNTKSQMKISHYKERQTNMSDAFQVIDPKIIKGKSIILVDDVATTGSTILECAKTLKKAGAKEIFAIVVARQSFSTF
jgi:ComF family protein